MSNLITFKRDAKQNYHMKRKKLEDLSLKKEAIRALIYRNKQNSIVF